jgi:hypothetical protein
MKVQDITVLQSVTPITLLKGKSNQDTVTFLQKFLDLPCFIDNATKLRKLFKIPDTGLDIKQYEGTKLY